MLQSWICLLLPIAAGCGWWGSKRSISNKSISNEQEINNGLYRGLNFIINDRTDEALDEFLKLSRIDSQTVDIHFTLGTLLRQKGEYERAVRIHQNILARPSLGKSERMEAMLALAKDYFASGVFDKADHLARDVIQYGYKKRGAYELLLSIYQTTGEWSLAIDVAKKIGSRFGDSVSSLIAHFYAELAYHALTSGEELSAKQYLKKGFTFKRYSPRLLLISAQMAVRELNYKKAWNYYNLLSEYSLHHLFFDLHSFVKLSMSYDPNNEAGVVLQKMLDSSVESFFISAGSQAWPWIRNWGLKIKPTGKNKLFYHPIFELYSSITNGQDVLNGVNEKKLKEQLELILQNAFRHKRTLRCHSCGIQLAHFEWCCPSCKKWDSVRFPIN